MRALSSMRMKRGSAAGFVLLVHPTRSCSGKALLARRRLPWDRGSAGLDQKKRGGTHRNTKLVGLAD